MEEKNNKINITSSAVEKGLDIAKDFLDKLILPSIEEVGLLIKDKVTFWRLKNQVNTLNKAQEYCIKNDVAIKSISLKLLVPLLENASLEEDEFLQNKWAILLSNMVDSEQNIENHVFPYILSQISRNEFLVLEKVYDEKIEKVKKLTSELDEFIEQKPFQEREVETKLIEIDKQIEEKRKEESDYKKFEEIWALQKQRRIIESKQTYLKYHEATLKSLIKNPQIIPYDSLEEFEFSNVIRLGLAKEEKDFFANSQTLEIPNEREYDRSHTNIDIDIEVESNIEIILTQLGELFIGACKEKKKKTATNSGDCCATTILSK